ncbi:hypothetical protein IFM89_036267 [Coptis chinensis]|uniref:Protein kinase domain-containing protein n=1 Tax=Coptis chinensis TaxID=261450 RepID=A0A835HQ65_9MAGN|nr:hypothetical protein IFM89_036267 [Coptis chinensis]
MSFISKILHCWWGVSITILLALVVHSLGLNTDGTLLLSFKYNVLNDPFSVLGNWNYEDETPCLWTGVMCTSLPYPGASNALRVVALVLPNNKLLGSIPEDLGLLEHLRHLDLSSNYLNGSLPNSLFNSSELKILDLSTNEISGQLPNSFQGLNSLQLLNLSDNALTGKIPQYLSSLHDLTALFLRNNYFIGEVPSGFSSLEAVDLSSNLINGSLPKNFGGESLNYLNFSYNKISGDIPIEFATKIPANATIDLSFNTLTGEVPETSLFLSQTTEHLAGNPDLCGKHLKNSCLNSSVVPNATTDSTSSAAITPTSTTSPPAIAAIPKTIDSSPATDSPGTGSSSNGSDQGGQSGLRPAAIVGIVVGDLAGIGIFSIIFLYVYQAKKKKRIETSTMGMTEFKLKEQQMGNKIETIPSPMESKGVTPWLCLRQKGVKDEETSETTASETDSSEEEQVSFAQPKEQKTGTLVTVDGDSELELEALLKASAYILGASGSSIVYKAVLEDGTTFAVRRIGEIGVERFKDFENQVKLIGKLQHPNIVRIRGFYWGSDEKLIIYDHVTNGSLANIGYKRPGSSPYHLPWESRLRIARGVARGLTYLHDKKHVHGNLKPSNILLGSNMEPQIGDFGLEKMVWGDNSSKAGGSARNFGSKRSTASRDSFQDLPMGASPSPSAAGCLVGPSPYSAPESLKNLKPNVKWDVYSFGLVLLELLTGKVNSDNELGHWSTGLVLEETSRVLRMADVAIRAEVEGKEDILMICFKLGFSCVSIVPQKRPSMKEVLQILEKIPSSSHYYDH